MEEFLVYISGWITFIILFYLWEYALVKNPRNTRGLTLYRGFKLGILSWVSILGYILLVIIGAIYIFDNNIENKLK